MPVPCKPFTMHDVQLACRTTLPLHIFPLTFGGDVLVQILHGGLWEQKFTNQFHCRSNRKLMLALTKSS